MTPTEGVVLVAMGRAVEAVVVVYEVDVVDVL